MNKLAVGFVVLTLFVFASVDQTLAESYPNKAIRFVVPWTPGGSNDVLARITGQNLQEAWGQPVVIENRPGASGNIGSQLVRQSAPDGYTFLIAANTVLCINPCLQSPPPFDPFNDFVPVAIMGAQPTLLVVNPSVQAKSVKELVALLKAKPDSLVYGSSGAGSPQHMTAELFKVAAGVSMVHVAYKGAAQTIPDLLSGQVQVLFSPVNSILPHVKSGGVRAVAVASPNRTASLPDIPTIDEGGVRGVYGDMWISIVAPKGISMDIVNKMNREVKEIFSKPDVIEKLKVQGMEPMTRTPAEFATLIRNDFDQWSSLIKKLGIRAE